MSNHRTSAGRFSDPFSSGSGITGSQPEHREANHRGCVSALRSAAQAGVRQQHQVTSTNDLYRCIVIQRTKYSISR